MQSQAQYDEILQFCKQFSTDVLNSDGNVIHGGRQPRCSDLEIIALSLYQENLNMGSERYFFALLCKANPELANKVGTLRNYNARRRRLAQLMEEIRKKFVAQLNACYDSQILIVDSMPLPVCRYSRSNSSKIFKDTTLGCPTWGYCSAQQEKYFGYKFHAVCSRYGVIQTYDLSPANVADINYLKDISELFSNCVLIGDKGYHSARYRQELFDWAGIELATPCKKNELLQYSMPEDYMEIRKRIEVVFSQLTDQFSIRKNYAKSQSGLHVRIISKITLHTLLQFINMKNKVEINHVRYTLAA